MRTLPLVVLVCGFAALLGEAQAVRPWGSPDPAAKPAPCGTGGSITERASSGFIATFEIVITDCNGKEIPKSRKLIEGVGNVSIDVPGVIDGQKVGDFKNHNVANRHIPRAAASGPAAATLQIDSGAESFLNGESLFRDPVSGRYEFENAFAQYDYRVGSQGYNLRIPDLYADTNGDGIIGVGDVLYSWVDLRIYPQVELPTYALGDTFKIVDGRVAQLPGMYFSATEIVLDPVLGPRPSGGSWFNPSGPSIATASPFDNSVALTEHELTSTIPESSTWLLMLSGLGLLAQRRRRGPRLA